MSSYFNSGNGHNSAHDAADMRQRNMPEMAYTSSPVASTGPDSPFSQEKSERPSHPLGHSQDSSNSSHGKEGSGDTTTSGRYYRNYFAKGAHKKSLRKEPLITPPAKGTEDVWIESDQEAVEWLSLFYDLVVVALLTIFSTQHELSNPAAIPVFLSFFVIIFWTWVAQTAFDMRYQGNDALNRFFKFLQIGLFIYQGAASGNWNPGKIERITDTDDPYGARVTQHDAALASFTTVVVAFAVSRAVLMVQYGICMLQGKRAGRHIGHIGINIVGLLASMILAIVAFCLPATRPAWKVAKIVLFYSGIGVEVINVFVGILLRVQPPFETHKVAERYGAFTLIVLGEGFISVTKAFNKAISGLSDDDSGTYIQVFLTILILFLLYSFLFGTFDKNDHTGHGRATVWQILHFPLCFGILLLIAAMVNVVVTLSSTHGLTLILNLLDPYSQAVYLGNGQNYLEPTHLKLASKYMNKLSLEPTFAQAITEIFTYLNETTPALDPVILYTQYAAQIGYTTYQKYGVEIPAEAANMYQALYALNTTWLADPAERLHAQLEAGHMFTEVIQDIINDSFAGVLWLLPVAGGVLILIALRSMLWYRFLGAAHWIYHGSQLVAGVCLALLGFLDIGSKHIDIARLTDDNSVMSVNPLYRVLFQEVPLVIVGVVYLVVYLGSGVAIWFMQWRQQKGERAKALRETEKAERPQGLGVEVDPDTHQMEERR